MSEISTGARPDGPGERLQNARKRRGLTQRELAYASGLSVSMVRKIEQGQAGGVRLETARKLAVALRIPTSAIAAGDREAPDGQTAGEWEPVCRALAGHVSQPGSQPTPAGVMEAVAAMRPVIAANRFTPVRPALAALIRDAYALDPDDPDTPVARFRALNMTGWVLTQMRQWDAAMDTLAQAQDSAPTALEAASAVKTRIWLLLRQGDLAGARDAAVAAADAVEPRFSRAAVPELSLWGHFQLNIANAAIRDNRPGEAAEALRLAAAAASLIGREVMADPSTTRVFGPATVACCRAEIAVLDEKPDRALAISAQVPGTVFAATDMTRLRHQLDVANADAQLRRYTEAIAVIGEIWRVAPEWLPQQRYARDILGGIVQRRRTLTPDMRVLADAVRLPL